MVFPEVLRERAALRDETNQIHDVASAEVPHGSHVIHRDGVPWSCRLGHPLCEEPMHVVDVLDVPTVEDALHSRLVHLPHQADSPDGDQGAYTLSTESSPGNT